MTLPDILRLLRRSWLAVLVTTCVGIGTGVWTALLATPLYRAEAELFVSVQTAADASEIVQGNSAAQQKVASYLEVIQSASVLQPVIDELRLGTDVEHLAERVTASSPANSVLVDIAVLDEDPAEAVRITTAIADSFRDVVTDELERPLGGGAPLVGIRTIQPPVLPSQPDSPNLVRYIALGLLSGLALGFGFVLVRHASDTRIRTREDLEALSMVPIIGDITFDASADEHPLIVQVDPRSPRAEAFRTLRTNVQFIDHDATRRTFTVTSALPAEGKSTTAANLALTLAETGARVALVDADLRRPRLATILGVEGAAGLTDVLIGAAELEDVLLPWGKTDLHVLPAGRVPPNPSELLGSEAMRRLVDLLTVDHDAVIIDAPPLLPVTDATILSRLTGGAIVIAAAGRASRQQLRSALEMLESVGSHAVGVVMTMRREKHGRGATYSAYYGQQSPTAATGTKRGRRVAPHLAGEDMATG
jgi:capsular exopolysaccharide synthesis family protein